MTQAILINAEAETVSAVEFNGLAELQKLVGGYIEAAHRWANGDVLFVDEEGLLKPSRWYFAITVRPDQPLAGNGVIVGREVDDDSDAGYHNEAPTLTVEAVRDMVRFVVRLV